MRENHFFIKSTELDGLAPVLVAGAPAAASYERVIDDIERLCGREAASLFGEPVLPLGGGANNAVSWYGRREGAAAELLTYDEIARRPIAERLQQRIEALRPALDDPRLGPIVRAWLHVAAAQDILVVGGEPMLVNWGYLPAAVGSSPKDLRTHQEQTFGRFLPRLAALGLDGGGAEAAPASGQSAEPPRASDPSSEAAPAPSRSAAGVARPEAATPAWRAPLIASAIAAALLAFLLLPGVLVYPESANTAARDALEVDRLKASNRSLEAQLAALESAGKDRACRLPSETAPVPGLPNNGVDPSKREPRMELVPRSPDKAELPPTPGESGAKTVAELLDKSTVLVLGLAAQGGGGTQGSGFFINDHQIITNNHVIENVDPQFVFVASQAIGGIRHARIVAKTTPSPAGDGVRPDFAVLEIDPIPSAAHLKLGVTPPKLSTAYVAGFPGFLTERDAAFGDFIGQLKKSLSTGDIDEAKLRQQTAVPGADLRYGRVNNLMASGDSRLPIIIHDMQLAPGNSGGPLVDACGRVGGVNTLLFPSDADDKSLSAQQGNVALDVSLLQKFLGEQHIVFQADSSRCEGTGP